jgi:NAD kinase
MKIFLNQEKKKELFEKTLIVYLEGLNKESRVIKRIIKRKFKTRVKSVCRKFLKRLFCNNRICRGYSLIVSFGGDGTFLRTAHFVNDTPILGINASVNEKEGFLTTTTKETLGNDLEREVFIEEIPRIKILINGKEIPDRAVNDVFIGHKKSYKTAKYELIFKEGRREEQLSSGVIISTAAGTNAWYKSAGGSPQKNKNLIYYIVREAYHGRIYKPKNLRGSAKEIKIMALKNLVLVVDSLSKEYVLKRNDIVTLKLDSNKLKKVNFVR